MGDYYEILNLNRNCSEKEIKGAYKNALKRYPPQKCAEEFKKIREAYEVLIDTKARAEYDAMNKYSKEIEMYMAAGNSAMEKEEYKNAVREFRKVLVIHPTYSVARNQLGLALLYDGDKDGARIQFEKLVSENPKNATYAYNLGYVYKRQEQYLKAEEMLLKAYALDKIDTNVVTELADLYSCMDKEDKAIKILDDAIAVSGKEDFENFIYFFKEVEIYILKNKIAKAENIIDEIISIMPDDKETREYVAWKFGKMAYELYEADCFYLAEKIANKAMDIDPDNKDIASLYNAAKELKELNILLKRLMDDSRIAGPIKGPAYYYVKGDSLSEDELKKGRDENLNAIQTYIDNQPYKTMEYIDLLKREYFALYTERKELYDLIYTKSQEKIRINQSSYRSTSSSGSGCSPCFVATAAFGTPWALEIQVLRNWRDYVLRKKLLGRAFIKFYYIVGPYAAKVVKRSEFLRAITRKYIRYRINRIHKKYKLL